MSETTDKKKFLGLSGVKLILDNLKEKYSPLGHTHDDLYYTEAEVDDLLLEMTSGNTVVAKAEEAIHATNADKATNAEHSDEATHALNADNAVKAEQDAKGNVIDLTYETKEDAIAKLQEAKEYTNLSVANLVNSAPETLDTLGELAAAFEENSELIDVLNKAITEKATVDHTHIWNDLEDKPFGEEKVLSTIVPETTVVVNRSSDLGIFPCLEENKTYVVKFNGIEYVCECRITDISGEGDLFYIIGNGSYDKDFDGIMSDGIGNDEPFQISQRCAKSSNIFINAKDGEYTVSIHEVQDGIKQLDEKFIPDTISRTEHTHSYNDLEDRPFYEDIIYEVLIPETTINIEDDNSYGELPDTPLLTIGQTYRVILNGIEYICVARQYDDEDALIGNGNIYGDDGVSNGEPFACDSYESGGFYLNTALAGEYTFSLDKVTTTIKKIDEKFIPDNVKTHDWNTLENRPFGEEDNTEYVLEEQTIFIDDLYYFDEWLPLIQDEMYTVCLNGIEYTGKYVFHGDADPYMIINDSNFRGALWEDHLQLNEFSGYVTISVYQKNAQIKQLDEKYIPDTIARKSDLENIEIPNPDWNESDETALSFIKNRTHYEVADLLISCEFTADGGVENDYLYTCQSDKKDALAEILTNSEYLFLEINGVSEKLISESHDTSDGYIVLFSRESDGKQIFGFMADEYNNIYYDNEYESMPVTFTANFYSELELKQLDEKFIPDTISRTDHVHSYNDLTDRTHYEISETKEFNLSWDGNIDGKEYVQLESNGYYFVKVTDDVSIMSLLEYNDYQINAYANTTNTLNDSFYITKDGGSQIVENLYGWGSDAGDMCYIALSDVEFNGAFFTKGTWFAKNEWSYFSDVTYSSEVQEIKQLDEKFIPDTIATKEYVDEHILSKEEVITLLTETGFISPATTTSGDIYTDSDGDIYVM